MAGLLSFFLPSSSFFISISHSFWHSLALSLSLQSIRWYTKCIHNSQISFAHSYSFVLSDMYGVVRAGLPFLPSLLPCLLPSAASSFFRPRSRALRLCKYFPRIPDSNSDLAVQGGNFFLLFFSLHLYCIALGVFVFFPFLYPTFHVHVHVAPFFFFLFCEEERAEERERERERILL